MQHPLNITPASVYMDGQEWVPAEWASALADALRDFEPRVEVLGIRAEPEPAEPEPVEGARSEQVLV